MSTVVSFKNKNIVEPGVYAQVKSKVPVSPNDASYGNVTIIDTGSGDGFGGGSGITGELASNFDSVYAFSNANDARSFLRGGILWDIVDYLFNPLNGQPGIANLFIVRGGITACATSTYTFTGGGTNGGTFKYKTKNEGKGANGLTDEKQASGLLNLSLVHSTDVLLTKVGAVTIGTYTALSGSLSTARTALVNSINTLGSSTGFSAVLSGTSIKVTAPVGTGVAGNALTFDLTGVTGATMTGTAFSGGVDGTKIAKGYGSQMKVGIIDPTKWFIEFYEGTWRGLDADGDDFGGITKYDALPITIAKSPEFDNLTDLISWAQNDFTWSQRYVVDVTSAIAGDGSIDSTDYTSNSALKLASGGTCTYNSTQLDLVFPQIIELDNTFFLADKYGDQAQGAENTKILYHISNEAEFDKFMVVGGGIDETKFTGTNGSIETAQYFDSVSVHVCHSGFKIPKLIGAGTKKLSAFYHAANFLGRMAGLQPQVPVTFKGLRAKNFNHVMTLPQRVMALQAGVIHNRMVPQIGQVVNQSVNTLQRNTQMINPDGTSFEISIMRIAAQLNKELILNMRPLFVGGNNNTSSPADVKTFGEGYLTGKTATKQKDNLILRFENVTVTVVDGDYFIEYGFVPNGPVNKLFVTGFMLSGNLSA